MEMQLACTPAHGSWRCPPTSSATSCTAPAAPPAPRAVTCATPSAGPLEGGLCLPCADHQHLLQLIQTISPRASHQVHTLALFRPLHCDLSDASAVLLLPAIAAAFPALRTLHLPKHNPITADSALLLALLCQHLTCLEASVEDVQAAACLARTLTRLRSLDLRACDGSPPLTPSALQPLLPTLEALSLSSRRNPTAADCLRHTTALTRLTHLGLSGVTLTNWDQEAVALLASSMPRLQSLHIMLEIPQDDPAAAAHQPVTGEVVMTTLARRTALTRLQINIDPHFPCTFLEPLQLAEICATVEFFRGGDLGLLHLLRSQAGSLTCLHLACWYLSPRPTLGTLIKALPLLPDRLVHLHVDHGLPSLQQLLPLTRLTRLESLRLHARELWPSERLPHETEAAAASSIATALTHLTSLSLQLSYKGGVQWLLVPAVARQGALRDLHLRSIGPALVPHLTPLAGTLVRLTLPVHPSQLLEAIESVNHLQALRSLRMRVIKFDRYGGRSVNMWPLPSMSASEFSSDGAESSSAAAAAASDAGGASTAHRSAPAAAASNPRVLLPPGLRQLRLELEPDLFPRKGRAVPFPRELRGALLQAAARQDCEVVANFYQSSFTVASPPQHDDCQGYLTAPALKHVTAFLPERHAP